MEILLSKIVVSFLLIGAVSCACTFPQSLRNCNWTDSHKGLLRFGNDTLTGWTFITAPLVNVWKCLNFTSDGSGIHLLVQAPQEFNYYGANGTGFLCMKMSQLTSYSFSYYLEWGEQPLSQLGYQRVTVHKSMDIKNGSISTTFAKLCLESSHPGYPQFQEYHILIKTGYESLAITECPSTIFGVYWYIVKDIANSKSFCGSKNESWDVCSDYQRMTVNPQRCNQTVLYSGNGSLFCVNSISSGSYTALTLYNDDDVTVDGISTYRFTCLVSSMQSNGSLLVSQSPGSCNKDQTPTAQPKNVLGAVDGLNIELYPKRLCPKTSDDVAETGGLSAGVIAGIVIGVMLLVTLVVLTILLCIFKKCRHPEEKDDDMKTPVHSPRTNKHVKPERLPDIPEEEDSVKRSVQSLQEDGIHVSAAGFSDHDYCFQCSMHTGENTSYYSFQETNSENINPKIIEVVANESNCYERGFRSEDTVENLKDSMISDDGKHDDKVSDIEITRIMENDYILRKDVPHLNSTENIFSEYDAAMSYATNKIGTPKEEMLPSVIKTVMETKDIFQEQNTKSFEFSRDDSDLNLKTKSKLMTDATRKKEFHKSESNLTDAVKLNKLKNKPSKISSLNISEFKWNFDYTSPYSMSEKQKKEVMSRKVRLEKIQKQREKRKRQEREKREKENTAAFEKWKQTKKVQLTKAGTSKKSASQTIWYPP